MNDRKILLPKLYPYQADVLANASFVNTIIFGRRSGKTHTMGTLAISSALKGGKVSWTAPSYKNTIPLWEFLEEKLSHLDGSGLRILRSEKSVMFESGGWIRVFSADNPTSLLGFGVDIAIVDEASRIRDERIWEEAIRPTLADRGGRAFLVSTPRGKNYLYRLFLRGMSGEPGFYSKQLPSTASPNPNIRRFAIESKKTMPPLIYRQEIEAQFIDDGEVFPNVQEICCVQPLTAPIPDRTYVAGVDFARVSDYTVIAVFDASSREMVFYDRFTGISYHEQIDRIEEIINKWHIQSVLAEQNSMGAPLVEFLQQRNLPVTGFVTTNRTKQEIIDALVLSFANKSIKLIDDPQVTIEFLSYSMDVTPGGLIKYGGSSGVNDDVVMAVALAYQMLEDDKPLLFW